MTHDFKFIVIGDSGVGKSCLVLRFTDDRFRPYHDLTIGTEFGAKDIELQGEPVHMQIWDTAGQETFRSITRGFYKGASAAVLVYDITRRASFLAIENWLQEIEENASFQIVKILIGNKTDLDYRVISPEEGREFALRHHMLFAETSAKTGFNVDLAFTTIAQEVLDRERRGELNATRKSTFLRVKNEKSKGCCSG